MGTMEWNSKLQKWTKECTKCKRIYQADGARWEDGVNNLMQYFRPHPGSRMDSLYTQCKNCVNHIQVGRVDNGKTKLEMLEEQDGKCCICNKHLSNTPFGSVVDHNHTTGEIRGILCSPCNTRLAALENPEWLRRATLYLEAYSMEKQEELFEIAKANIIKASKLCE